MLLRIADNLHAAAALYYCVAFWDILGISRDKEWWTGGN